MMRLVSTLTKSVLISVLAVFALSCAFVVSARPAEAVAPVTILEAVGILVSVTEGEPSKITLAADDVEASGVLLNTCEFRDDKGLALERKDFLKRYIGKVVTVEFYAEIEGVYLCRAASTDAKAK